MALLEDKEVVVALDANIDHLTWRLQNNLPSSSSSKLKPLIDALFTKIIPMGVSQLVVGPTRFQRGQPKTGLDHVYTNKLDKLSSVQTYFTPSSDHKLLKFVRFAKSLKLLPRYIRKRSFKDFDVLKFKENIDVCGLEDVLKCSDVYCAAKMLTDKLSSVLDSLAPIKRVQICHNYAP